MKIKIVMEVEDEFADPEHDTGLTNAGWELMFRGLSHLGYDIEVEREE